MIECAYGDTRLTDFWTVTDIVRPVPSRVVSTESVTGLDGDVLMGSRYESGKVTFSVWSQAPYVKQPEELLRIVHAFDSNEPQRLWFSDEDDRYRMAIAEGAPTITQHMDAFCVQMSLLVPEPALYGRHISVQVPSGGSATFLVNGTYPTRPRISAPLATRSSASGVWGIKLDDGDFLKVPLSSGTARSVQIDCAQRECLVAGTPALPTLDSDWLELRPGRHTLTNWQGAGACVIEWDERWL